jgi:hypothetical protein
LTLDKRDRDPISEICMEICVHVHVHVLLHINHIGQDKAKMGKETAQTLLKSRFCLDLDEQ